MSKSITKELKTDKITINKLCPGIFYGDRVRSLIKERTRKTNKIAGVVEKVDVKNLPLGRYQTREVKSDIGRIFRIRTCG